MSEFKCPVVKLTKINKHPNADSLSLTEIEGCTVIFRTQDYALGDLVVYIPIEAVVPDNEDFAFLKGKTRIKAAKLRGIFSMGLLVKAPKGAKEGQDLAKKLGITKYEEPDDETAEAAPKSFLDKCLRFLRKCLWQLFPRKTKHAPIDAKAPVNVSKYDIESFRKYHYLFKDEEIVSVTEKLHGQNFRAIFKDGKLHIGSRSLWKLDSPQSEWWAMARKYDLATKLAQIPDILVYAEHCGAKIQDLGYDLKEPEILVFDMLSTKTGKWLSIDTVRETCERIGLKTVPVLYHGPYNKALLMPMAEGKSTLTNKHVREGWVIRPAQERTEPRFGRLILKLHGEGYLLRKNPKEGH